MEDFLNQYIFHWTAEKAIFINGHPLLWDARCAGIYVGFGIGIIYLFLSGRKHKNLPPLPILIANTFMLMPMFIDLISIWIGMRTPSNDTRYLTGILFGGAISIYIYPAFVVLVLSSGQDQAVIGSLVKYGLFLFLSLGGYFIKNIDRYSIFVSLNSLSIFGFLCLLFLLLISSTMAAAKIAGFEADNTEKFSKKCKNN